MVAIKRAKQSLTRLDGRSMEAVHQSGGMWNGRRITISPGALRTIGWGMFCLHAISQLPGAQAGLATYLACLGACMGVSGPGGVSCPAICLPLMTASPF